MTKTVYRLGMSLALLIVIPACEPSGNRAGTSTTPAYVLPGLCWGPFVDGADPNHGAVVSEEQVRERLRWVARHTRRIRLYGSRRGLEIAARVATTEFGLEVAAGAWISKDPAENMAEIEALIAICRAGYATLAVVGSECMLRGDVSESDLIGYIRYVRERVPTGIPVCSGDTTDQLLARPGLTAACDVVLYHEYPFWRGLPLRSAIAALHDAHQRLVAANPGKPAFPGESGWPSEGQIVSEAVPSPENAAAYFLEVISWARAIGLERFYYFEAMDEPFKAAYEGPVGGSWGILDRYGILKPGMDRVFRGEFAPDTWSGSDLIDGPGQPALLLTSVPPLGSFADLQGRALHVAPAEVRVAVYIFVGGGWWTKPTFEQPAVPVRAFDGVWSCDITTGGADEQATLIEGFLLPATFLPAPSSGAAMLPSELYANALARVSVVRSP